jgi:hypothetical protein
MGRNSKLKQARREHRQALESSQHMEAKKITQKQGEDKKLANLLQNVYRTYRQNEEIANELGIKPVLPIILNEDFSNSAQLLEEVNLGRFDLQEVTEVLHRVYGSGLMKSMAAQRKMPLYEYCSMLLSSWLNGIPQGITVPKNSMLRIAIDCNSFEMLSPISILSVPKVKELFPEFIPDIRTGATIMMELVYSEEDAMFFAMHLRSSFSKENTFEESREHHYEN